MRLCLLCLLWLLSRGLMAQPKSCGQDEATLWPRYAAHLQQARPLRSDSLRRIPLVIHLTARANGNGRPPAGTLLDLLCDLNALYTPAGMTFFLPPGGIRLVNHDGIFSQHTLSSSQILMNSLRDPAALNVFVVQQAAPGGGVSGYYDALRDWVIVQRDQIRPGNRTLAHEIGHFFSLLHPHFGWDGLAWDSTLHGNPPGPLASDGLTPTERADGSNCETAGDRLCDTPPDYNFGLGWSQSCTYAGGALDPVGMGVDPDERLIMSYFADSCRHAFSEEQMALMQLDYASPARDFLRQAPPDTLAEPAPVPPLLLPLPDATLPRADSVVLRWGAVPGAGGYLLQVDRSPQFDLALGEWLLSDTSRLLTGLLASQRYYWRVRSYRRGQTCGSFSASQSFYTGFYTAVATPWPVQLAAHYQPVGRLLHLRLRHQTPLRGSLRLLTPTGQPVWTQSLALPPGQHTLQWPLPPLASGLYLLQVPGGQVLRLWLPAD